ncbi:beta-xylosidase [Devosia pacifica]|uniref:Beta-xylosidase n=1 Tax=Devosia pacifica TaxID=1335967 RepID=A0A918S0J3_9HYPH|nr:beta-xylosidase [Devosia pacifica]GHA18166.1 beta-xylosidase [Devosia pacifica]
MPQTYDVAISVDANKSKGPYKPLWNWFGHDEPNYTYTPNGKKLLRELAELSPGPAHIRTHNLLTSGDGQHALKWGSTNAYTEDENGNPVYDWTIMDQIFDSYKESGTSPLIQVGFTPEALSDDPGPYQHSWSLDDRYATIMTGWAAPPNNLEKWGGLIEAWANHLVERYGIETVRHWPWEVWNEPDGHYWTGTIPEFCAMYDVTAKAIKKVISDARVGGPHTCGGFSNPKAQKFLREFLQHVVDNNSPIDFIAFHAKGNPVVYKDHVRMGVSKQLRDIETNLAIINEFPQLTHLPVVIGESDPEGCAACSARVHPQNGYRNGPLYGVYVVESMLRTYELSRQAGIEIEGAVTWAFMFEDQPYFDGFRDLATNGIDKAVLNGFRMLGMLSGEWVEAESDHALDIGTIMEHGVRGQPDVNAVATKDEKGVSVLVWNYHDDNIEDGDASVTVSLANLPEGATKLRHYRMDKHHSNAYQVWQDMGSPQTIEGADYDKLEAAGKLAMIEETSLSVDGGNASVSMQLPRQGVSLLRIE